MNTEEIKMNKVENPEPQPSMPNWYNDNEEGDILDLLIAILEEWH